MRSGVRTAVVLAIAAVACTWWAVAGGVGGGPCRWVRVDGGPPPAPPIEHQPALAEDPDGGPGAAAAPDPATEGAVQSLEALGDLASAFSDGGSSPAGYRKSWHREMPEAFRAERLEAARKDLEPLLEEFRRAGPGAERAEVLDRMTGPLRDFMGFGGGFEHLALLAESAEHGETREERARAVIATHLLWQPEVVDWLEERTRSRHDSVRLYAFEGFAWVVGDERPRALENLVRGLEDPVVRVRAVAALSLGAVVADPAHVPALVARLGREEDPWAARALVKSILRLDPAGGAARVRAAASGAAARAVVEEEIAALGRTAAK